MAKTREQVTTTSTSSGSSDSKPASSITNISTYCPICTERINKSCNLIFLDIPEAPHGTRFGDRLLQDHKTISTICESTNTPVPPASLKECFRLGKYDQHRSRPRPILAKFNSIANTTMILENKSCLFTSDGKSVPVKHNLPKDQRQTARILLNESH